jgi:glycosyltransferase involved in cell wall biosynthesis
LASESVAYTPLLHLFLGHDAQDAAEEAASDVSYNSTILFFGRLMEYKGVEILLEAYSKLRKQKEAGRKMPQLVLAGSGSLKGDWSTRLPSGVEWRDRFIGDHEAMDLFRSCSLLILPYLDGTQSSIIASAYYFRKPVVATNVGAFAEYIDDGETGFLVAPDDPEAILLALLNLIDHESHLRTMGMAGREWYDNQRDQETTTLVNLYQESHRQSN